MSALARSLCAVAVFLVVASTAVAAPTPTINEFGDGVITNNAAATGIALGPDGNLYVTEFGTAGNRMARVAPDGTVTELPQFPTATAGAQNVALGPDGRMYVTEANVGKIAVFSPSDPSAIQEFATPTTNSQPHEIAVGPDGKLWFGEAGAAMLGTFSTTTPSDIHEFPAGGLGMGAEPYGLVTGPDGALWFTERGGNAIGRLDVANPNAPETFSAGLSPSARPRMIAVGADRRLWFTEQGISAIGAIDPVTHVIHEFPTPTANANPIGIAAGPDGALWFTENSGGTAQRGAIGRITTDGTITEYPLTPRTGETLTGVWNIAMGSDGNMWFPEIIDERVGRITTGPVATTGTASGLSSTGATVSGSVDGHAQATSFRFDYGTSAAYGSSTAVQALGTVTGPRGVSAAISGLSPSTTYHYRVVAINPTDSALGADATFTTAPAAAPAVSALRMGHRWRLGRKLPKVSRKAPVGTTIRFVLSKPGAVKLRFLRKLPGRRSGRRCVPPTRRNRTARRCTRRINAGSLSFAGHAGTNSVRFQGRLSRRRTLKPGRYILSLTASAEGKTSRPKTATFTVLPSR
jgi:streptogramin lyase